MLSPSDRLGFAVSLAGLPFYPLQASELSNRFVHCHFKADKLHGVVLGTETAGRVEQVRDNVWYYFNLKTTLELLLIPVGTNRNVTPTQTSTPRQEGC